MPELLIVIGANGAGKSTWADGHRSILPKPFYDADLIAKGLGDPDNSQLQARAARFVIRSIATDLRDQQSFGFESTYSGRSRPALVRRARELGYSTHAVFIGTEHHDINIHRVQQRVREGGHDVAVSAIIRRWKDSQSNLIGTWTCFDAIEVVDNSGNAPLTIARQTGQSREAVTDAPRWVRDLLRQVDEGSVEQGVG